MDCANFIATTLQFQIMRRITLLSMGLLLSLGIGQAQENKTIVEKTTVKRVITKDGQNVVVKEVESTTSEKGTLIQKESQKEDADYSEATKLEQNEDTVVDKEKFDAENKARIEAERKKQEEQLERSRAEGIAKAEAERKILEQQQAERMKALEENRKKLEKRGKGVGRLSKKKKKGN
jgi:hypothetical protein